MAARIASLEIIRCPACKPGNRGWDLPVMHEEMFRLIQHALGFDDFSSALLQPHHCPAPPAFHLFTRDRANQDRLLAETGSGGVCLNDTRSHMLDGLPGFALVTG